MKTFKNYLLPLSLLLIGASQVNAGNDTSTLDTGDTAWMLTSSLLVLMMCLPGLALFYGGLVG